MTNEELNKAADDMAIKAFPEKTSYSTVVDRKENCSYYAAGYCRKGLPGTKCYPVGCVAMTDKPIESLSIHYPLRPTAPTWQDIKTIVEIADKMVEKDVNGKLPKVCETEEGYYKAILEQFNKTRK